MKWITLHLLQSHSLIFIKHVKVCVKLVLMYCIPVVALSSFIFMAIEQLIAHSLNFIAPYWMRWSILNLLINAKEALK